MKINDLLKKDALRAERKKITNKQNYRETAEYCTDMGASAFLRYLHCHRIQKTVIVPSQNYQNRDSFSPKNYQIVFRFLQHFKIKFKCGQNTY